MLPDIYADEEKLFAQHDSSDETLWIPAGRNESARTEIPAGSNHDHAVQRWLLTQGTREQVIGWLVWNDHNGIFTDEDSIANGVASRKGGRKLKFPSPCLSRDAGDEGGIGS
jgi:hypothetical protein